MALVRRTALAGLSAAQPHVAHLAGAGIGERDDDRGEVGKALFPDGVLDDDRHDVPPAVERARPDLVVHRHAEVGEDEQEAARGHAARYLLEVVERAREVVVGRVEAILGEPALTHFPESGLAAWRPPVRVVVREVEIADEPAGVHGAGGNQVDGRPYGVRLRQPWKARWEERHLRTTVADDDDAR